MLGPEATMKFTATVLTLLLLAGCGDTTKLLDRRPDYRGNATANPLEVPPDLTSSTIDDTLLVPELTPEDSANLSDYSRDRAGGQISPQETVLREQTGLRIERDGNQRWLAVEQTPTQLWPRLKEFWTSGGFALAKDDPRIGVMETEWLENRADIPDGPIRNALRRYLDFAYAAPTRDKFRVRLERGENDSVSDVYLTHYGVEEAVSSVSGNNTTRGTSTSTWVSRPADPELQAEMLNRLMVYLGASERRAQAELAGTDSQGQGGPRARLIDDPSGQKGLLIEQDYDRAWRLVGLALDGGRFLVEDQNRAEGLYLVEYRENPDAGGASKGLLSRLVFWRKKQDSAPADERYRVRLAGRGPQTLVVVHDDSGQPDNSATAQLILDKVRQTVQ